MVAYRKGISAIIFRRTGQGIKFLILKRKKNWEGWEFLKGGLKDRETELQALKREIKEETRAGRYNIIAQADFVIRYKWPKRFVKDSKVFCGVKEHFYLVQLFGPKIKIDREEHAGYRWVDAGTALRLLTYEERRRALGYALKRYKKSIFRQDYC